MIKYKHYNHRAGRVEVSVELTKGEQYQLMKENIALMRSAPKNIIKSGSIDSQGIDWYNVFNETVAFADWQLVSEYPTESANLIFD